MHDPTLWSVSSGQGDETAAIIGVEMTTTPYMYTTSKIFLTSSVTVDLSGYKYKQVSRGRCEPWTEFHCE